MLRTCIGNRLCNDIGWSVFVAVKFCIGGENETFPVNGCPKSRTPLGICAIHFIKKNENDNKKKIYLCFIILTMRKKKKDFFKYAGL